jgi:His/Glu/Gln/Arg/opine family amino acid ABC transporter permease subunit
MLEILSFGDAGYGDEMAMGALVTVQLAVLGYLLALVLGTLLGIATAGHNRVVRALWRVYASIFMGVPSLLVIFLFFFGGSQIVESLLTPLGWSGRVSVTPFMAGVIGLGMVYSAYMAEVVQGAIRNVPKGQGEAGSALAMPSWAVWWHVVRPQVIRLALPGMINLWIILLKDTAIVSLVGLNDIIAQAKIAAGSTRLPFVFYVAAALFFVGLSLATLRASRRIEMRYDRGRRQASA